MLIICISSDVGGYIIGKIFGGPKLTKISPNKTWSGTSSSLILSCFVLYMYFDDNLIYSLILASSFFFGDIYFSFIKRNLKLKDFSNLIPGHGGILDRFDSIFLFTIILPILKII